MTIDGKILLSMEDESEVPAGKLQVLLALLANASEDGTATFDVLDSAQDTADYLELFDEPGGWFGAVDEQFETGFGLDLLIIHRVEVDAAYRGKGLGLLAVQAAIGSFSWSCGLVAMKPFPLQFTGWEDEAWQPETPLPNGVTKEQAFHEASRKLERYWARLGFVPIKGTQLWGLSPAGMQPSLKEALDGIAASPL